jgi:type II secretory pathway pseudopilin PulG
MRPEKNQGCFMFSNNSNGQGGGLGKRPSFTEQQVEPQPVEQQGGKKQKAAEQQVEQQATEQQATEQQATKQQATKQQAEWQCPAELELYIKAISSVLEQICLSNSNNYNPSGDPFAATSVAEISIDDYLKRFAEYIPDVFDIDQYITMLIYIDRLINGNGYKLHMLNIHRVIAVASLAAMKVDHDYFYNNGFFARVSGFSLEEVNKLEKTFLFGIGFNLYIKFDEFKEYEKALNLQINNTQEPMSHRAPQENNKEQKKEDDDSENKVRLK